MHAAPDILEGDRGVIRHAVLREDGTVYFVLQKLLGSNGHKVAGQAGVHALTGCIPVTEPAQCAKCRAHREEIPHTESASSGRNIQPVVDVNQSAEGRPAELCQQHMRVQCLLQKVLCLPKVVCGLQFFCHFRGIGACGERGEHVLDSVEFQGLIVFLHGENYPLGNDL